MANPFRELLAVAIGLLWSGVLAHAGSLPKDNGPTDGGNASTTKQSPAPPQVLSLATEPALAPVPINLAQALDQWKRATAHVVRVDCRFKKYRYDRIFEAEYRGEGSMSLDCDGRARLIADVVVANRDEVSRRRNEFGKPYSLRSDRAEHWLWTDRLTIKVDPDRRLFERLPLDRPRPNSLERPKPPELPDDLTSESSASLVTPVEDNRWLEFFLGVKAVIRDFIIPRGLLIGSEIATLERDFEIELTKVTTSRVWLKFRPRNPDWPSSFAECVLILNRADWSPYAVKLVDPSRNSETVFVFSNLQFNRTDPGAPDLAFPNLTGYRPLKWATRSQTSIPNCPLERAGHCSTIMIIRLICTRPIDVDETPRIHVPAANHQNFPASHNSSIGE